LAYIFLILYFEVFLKIPNVVQTCCAIGYIMAFRQFYFILIYEFLIFSFSCIHLNANVVEIRRMIWRDMLWVSQSHIKKFSFAPKLLFSLMRCIWVHPLTKIQPMGKILNTFYLFQTKYKIYIGEHNDLIVPFR
jgi:hypothetical protein